MQTHFRHVALIGKYQAVSSGAAGASSRQALERIAHFLMDQGCEVTVEAETAANMGLTDYATTWTRHRRRTAMCAWWWGATAPCWALAASWHSTACR
jgi:hypothetical protein